MSRRKKVYVVPHSHWDREWYFTIEDSNTLLSQNIPYLMEVLENNLEFKSYTFDGQISIIEEYLKIYPEDRSRLLKLIEDKRIFVGPWYTQTDSLLVNKESIIRNLLYGTRLGDKFGYSMKVGYLPDIFGQNQYLPSIFKGFGIEHSVLQRGLYTDELENNLNFKWSSPDGEYVKANNIFLGYGPGKFLSSEDDYIEEKLIPMIEKLEALNKDSKNILLPAGGDQVLIREHFPRTIKELNEKQDKYEFVLSNYEEFMEETWKNDFKNEIKGELIACQKSRIHNTINSQRYDIKKANYDIENKLLYILEPLAVIGKKLGLRYPTSWLDNMWKSLFDVHAHDSIGGCNSDDTNREILNRIEKVDRTASGLINIIKKQITTALTKKLEKENILVLFNTKVQNSLENIEGVIFTKEENFVLKELNGRKVSFDLIKRDYISGGKKVIVTAEGEKEVELPGYYRSEVIINDVELPAMGYTTLLVEDGIIEEERILNTINKNEIENNFYRIIIDDNNISVINKLTDEKIENIFYFEEGEDCGDSYDYSPSKDDKKIIIEEAVLLDVKRSKNISEMTVVHKGKNLKSEEVTINSVIELRNNEEFIRIKHDINNELENHRVRVVLNTNINSKKSLSDEGFAFIERNNVNPNLENWRDRGFAEAPVPIYSMENIVALKENEKIFGVISKGIKEYEILDSSKIALTLFRSVGLLGKDDLLWRPGRASGINNKVVYTKDAQMIKNMKFEYAISLNESSEYDLFSIADRFIKRYCSYQKQDLNLFEERLERFDIPLNLEVSSEVDSCVKVENKNIIQSVFKEAYEKDGYILRLFNPRDNNESFSISGCKSIKLVNLYEEELSEVQGNIIIKPKGYVTLKIKL